LGSISRILDSLQSDKSGDDSQRFQRRGRLLPDEMSRENHRASEEPETHTQVQISASLLGESEGSPELLSKHVSAEAATSREVGRSNLQKAVHDYKLAGDQGIAAAQFNYGVCLENGRGVPIDFQQAAHYFKLAADQRVADAQFNYRVCLENGRGVPIDFQQAVHYFKLAADQGNAAAEYQ
jgi:TPR repeat protein